MPQTALEPNPGKRTAANPRLRPRGHQDQLSWTFTVWNFNEVSVPNPHWL